MKTIFLSTLAAALAVAALAQDPTPLLTKTPDQLIAVLKSDADRKAKADACRELAVIGGKDAVPVLAGLLADEKLNHMARYALETIPDPSVDAALRAALGKLQGRPLVGVIGSIGVRHYVGALEALAGKLTDSDADVAQAAARALGRLGTVEAGEALMRGIGGTEEGNFLAFCEGLARCMDALAAAGKGDQALTICDHYNDSQLPHQVRAAALRGAILFRGKDGLPVLKETLASPDYILFAAAIRISREMPGEDVTKILTDALAVADTDHQIVLLSALALRADRSSLPAVSAKTAAGDKPVRLAAIRALPAFGGPEVVPVLVKLLHDEDRNLAGVAQECLASVAGPETDAVVMKLLGSENAGDRLTGVELVGRRRMVACVPDLVKAAGDADGQVRPAALKRLGELAGPDNLPAVLNLLLTAKTDGDRDAAAQAASIVCAKADPVAACAPKVAALLPNAAPAAKQRLLGILGSIGGADALTAIRAAVNDDDAQVRGTAIRLLGSWKTAEAAPALLGLAQNAKDPADKLVSLQSYLQLAADADIAADQRLAMCKQAAGLVQRPEEKKLLLSALGGTSSTEALALIAPSLGDAATKEEAAAATLTVAGRLLKEGADARVAASLIEFVQKAAQATSNNDLAQQAKKVLAEARKKAGTQ